MNGLAYISVSREEGLVLLASYAHISVATLSKTNPVAYIKAYLDDCEGDQIELIIKMCQMLGPYTYRYLVQQSLDVIKEEEGVSDSVTSVRSSVLVTEPMSVILEEEMLVTEDEEIPVTVETPVTVQEPVTVETPVTVQEPVTVEEPVIVIHEEVVPDPVLPMPTESEGFRKQQQQIQEISNCCCFSFGFLLKR
jgi:hypothetical protein